MICPLEIRTRNIHLKSTAAYRLFFKVMRLDNIYKYVLMDERGEVQGPGHEMTFRCCENEDESVQETTSRGWYKGNNPKGHVS